MSFKRDGDDTALLRDLQKRRINHLLIDHIPEDEAKLLSNGRYVRGFQPIEFREIAYTCTICSYRPVFDTVEMLYSHRRGKKHQNYFTQHLAKLKDKEDRDTSKNLTQKTGQKPTIKNSLGSGNSLHKQMAYSSCRRKPTIDLVPTTSTTQKPASNSSKTAANKAAQKVVQTYLKNVQKKKSFEDVVKQSKKTYPKISADNVNKTTPTISQTTMESISSASSSCTILDENERERRKYYSKLRQSGWKKDWTTGQWVKDEDAEFDSDEETPDDSNFS